MSEASEEMAEWGRFWVESALSLRAYADATERAAAVTQVLVDAVKAGK